MLKVMVKNNIGKGVIKYMWITKNRAMLVEIVNKFEPTYEERMERVERDLERKDLMKKRDVYERKLLNHIVSENIAMWVLASAVIGHLVLKIISITGG